jgi:UDP-N-acetylmuramate--alanine ligase
MANATAALAVADAIGENGSKAAAALSSFKGAHRRFTHVGDVDGITVVDDYGHHPTEIRATLAAAKNLAYDRIVCVFQPHRYSRTQALADQFARAFDDADALVVTEVFSAGETPIPGVTGKSISKKIAEAGGVDDVTFIAKRKDLVRHLVDICRPGDLLITQGAGDVTAIGPMFIAAKQESEEGEGA